MRFLRTTSVLLVIFFLVVTLGCNSVKTNELSENNQVPTITVVDSVGREVIVPQEVTRIACLYAFTGHVTTMLDRGPNIVAVVNGLKRDKLLTAMVSEILEALVPSASDKINIEELIKTRPDVVLIKEETARDHREIEKLEKMKIPYLIITDKTIEEQQYAIKLIGQAVGNSAKAQRYLDYYQECIEKIQKVVNTIPEEERIKIFHSVNEATRTDAQGTLAAQWTTLAGAFNVSLEEELRFTDNKHFASLEQIYLWDPDVILVHEDNAYEYMKTNEQWAALRAVKENKIYKMPNGISRWGHPGSLETPLAILWTAKTLYPDKFSELDMDKETTEFYKEFFDYELSNEEVNGILAGKGMRIPK